MILLLTILHPYHVSVGEIVYNEKAKAVQISYRIFLDDLELALRQESGNDDLNIMKDSLLVHQTNQSYFKKNLKIKINDEPMDYQYLGGEIEDDAMWVYLEITEVEEKPKIILTNRLLTEIYDDQQNMIHFKIAGDKKSFILNKRDIRAVYEP